MEGIQFPGLFLLWVRLAFRFINLAFGTQPGTRGASPYKEITTPSGTNKQRLTYACRPTHNGYTCKQGEARGTQRKRYTHVGGNEE